MENFLKRLRRRALVWDTITTTGWSTLGKGVGFLVPFFIAAWFGVTAETDAFFFAYGLILFFSTLFAPVVESVIVPYIAEARVKNEDMGKFVGGILGVSGIGLLVLAGIVLLIIKPVLSVVTRFDSQSLDLVYLILLQAAPLIILLVWTSILSGALNAYKKFAFPAISPAFRAVINIGFIFTFKDAFGVYAIALGYVVGEVVRLVILAVAIRGFKLFKLGLSFRLGTKLKEFLKTASYQIIGMAAIGLNPIVDRAMASWLGEGSVSVLYYADRLYMIPVTFLCVGLFPVVLSHWSHDHHQNKEEPFLAKSVNKTVKVAFWISAIVFLILVFFSRPLVRLAFVRGEFDLKYVYIVQWTFICYLFGLIPYVAGSIFTRAHLAFKKTRFLMKLSFLNCFLNVVLNSILMKRIGVLGIALSTSITVLIVAILLRSQFSKRRNLEL